MALSVKISRACGSFFLALLFFLFALVTSDALKLKYFCGTIIYANSTLHKQCHINAPLQSLLRRANGCTQTAAQR